jgi:hypothetical protein
LAGFSWKTQRLTRPIHTDSLSRCAPSLSGDWQRWLRQKTKYTVKEVLKFEGKYVKGIKGIIGFSEIFKVNLPPKESEVSGKHC